MHFVKLACYGIAARIGGNKGMEGERMACGAEVTLVAVKTAILEVVGPGEQVAYGDLLLLVTDNLEWLGSSVVDVGLLLERALASLEDEGAVSVSRGVMGTFVSRVGI